MQKGPICGGYESVKCTLLYNHPGTIGLQLQIASRVAAAGVFVHCRRALSAELMLLDTQRRLRNGTRPVRCVYALQDAWI